MSKQSQQQDEVSLHWRKSKQAGPCEWLNHVRSVQFAQLTPQQREEIQHKVEAQQRVAKNAKKVKLIEARTKSAVYHTMQSISMEPQQANISAPPAPQQWQPGTLAPPAPQQWRPQQAKESMMEMEVEDDMYMQRQSMLDTRAEVAEEAVGRDNAEEERQFEQMVQSRAVTQSDFDKAVEELKKEPDDDEARAAKFEVYEKFSEKVESIRKELEQVAVDAKTDLPAGPVRDSVDHLMKGLESNEHRGIYDESRFWFVYDMVKKAQSNCGEMQSVSDKIGAKLRFIHENSQTDCPICLERFGPNEEEGTEVVPKMLSCCHSVCEDCWEQWVRLQGNGAFCPLCKNREFLEIIAREQPGSPEFFE